MCTKQMYNIPQKKYSKFPRVIDVIDGKHIIAYFKCPKCEANKSVSVYEIYDDGKLKRHTECSCGFIGWIRLKNWKNKIADL